MKYLSIDNPRWAIDDREVWQNADRYKELKVVRFATLGGILYNITQAVCRYK